MYRVRTHFREMGLAIAATLVAAFVLYVVAEPWWRERRRRALRSRPFPPAWRGILERRVPFARFLPRELRSQLEANIQVFVAEKKFFGCAGLDVTDEMRVTIAAHAALLSLNRKAYHYPNLREILVYPGSFATERLIPDPSGLLREERRVLSGESWDRGQVILSWENVVEGAAIPDDGRNVAIHEFAHQLDQQKGYANGAPWLGSRHRYPQWSRVMLEEFARLQQQAAWGEPSLLSHYGATSPAEFFAVASEVFFEQPREMAALHPSLYRELALFYRVDPAAW